MSKEKQINGDCKNCNSHIEEMAKDMCNHCRTAFDNIGKCKYLICDEVRKYAEVLYNTGYRKQIEAERVWDREHSNYKCSLCGEYDIGVPKFCRECGARMKGGAKE